MAKKITADCQTSKVNISDLSPTEQAAYDAQQPIGLAQAQAAEVLGAAQHQHQQALLGLRAALTANGQTTAADIASIQQLATDLQAGTAPTQAQVVQLLRFLLRCLATQSRA